ncbi:MAG: hypothetical protein KKB51_05460 [Candidatus Riflebacteria bacterium]|nr:hypothetical protein [Candidatus Riflebacteria bacterium]
MKLITVGMLCCALLFSSGFVSPESKKAGLSAPSNVGERFLDIHSYLFKIATRNDWSLIVSSEVNSSIKEVIGKTVEDALKNYLSNTKFSWRIFENCLYVADKGDLDLYFTSLPELEMTMPKGHATTTFSGYFYRIDLDMLCNMLRSISGVDIRPASGLQHSVMMRATEMSWQRVILAIIYLNHYRMDLTDYSITIFPADS